MNLTEFDEENEFIEDGASYTYDHFIYDIFGPAMPITEALELLKVASNIPGCNVLEIIADLYGCLITEKYGSDPYVLFTNFHGQEIVFKVGYKETFYSDDHDFEFLDQQPEATYYSHNNFINDIYAEPMPIREVLRLIEIGNHLPGNNLESIIAELKTHIITKKYGENPYVVITESEEGTATINIGSESDLRGELDGRYQYSQFVSDLINGSYNLDDAIGVLNAGLYFVQQDKNLRDDIQVTLRKLLTFIEFIEDDSIYEVRFDYDENDRLQIDIINVEG